jgi:hypothetical protein
MLHRISYCTYAIANYRYYFECLQFPRTSASPAKLHVPSSLGQILVIALHHALSLVLLYGGWKLAQLWSPSSCEWASVLW